MTPEDRADRTRALTVPCRPRPAGGCDTPTGSPCRNLITGEPLRRVPAHRVRLRDAGIIHAPLDQRDLRSDPDREARW